MMRDRSRMTMLVAVAVLYAVHALLTVHQHGRDLLVSMQSLPDLSAPSGHDGPDYALPIARLMAISGFAVLVLNVITSGLRGHGSKPLKVFSLLSVVLGGLIVLYGPMALGLPWYGYRIGWASAWYWVTVLADVTVVGLAGTWAWFGSPTDRRQDILV